MFDMKGGSLDVAGLTDDYSTGGSEESQRAPSRWEVTKRIVSGAELKSSLSTSPRSTSSPPSLCFSSSSTREFAAENVETAGVASLPSQSCDLFSSEFHTTVVSDLQPSGSDSDTATILAIEANKARVLDAQSSSRSSSPAAQHLNTTFGHQLAVDGDAIPTVVTNAPERSLDALNWRVTMLRHCHEGDVVQEDVVEEVDR